jgi:NADH:ubiquinone oxidoreductase subunit F (NADH-binding)
MFKELSVQEPVYPFSKFFRIDACEECVVIRAGQGFKGLSESLKRLYDAYQRTHVAESFMRAEQFLG